jgi:hypothetical protein
MSAKCGTEGFCRPKRQAACPPSRVPIFVPILITIFVDKDYDNNRDQDLPCLACCIATSLCYLGTRKRYGSYIMATKESSADSIQNLDDAKARIRELEKGMDEAIDVLLRRDAQVAAAERRILELNAKLDSLTQENSE